MRAAFAVLVLAVTSLLAGCGGADEGQILRRWTLHTRDASQLAEALERTASDARASSDAEWVG